MDEYPKKSPAANVARDVSSSSASVSRAAPDLRKYAAVAISPRAAMIVPSAHRHDRNSRADVSGSIGAEAVDPRGSEARSAPSSVLSLADISRSSARRSAATRFTLARSSSLAAASAAANSSFRTSIATVRPVATADAP